jgi:hypothetical protein
MLLGRVLESSPVCDKRNQSRPPGRVERRACGPRRGWLISKRWRANCGPRNAIPIPHSVSLPVQPAVFWLGSGRPTKKSKLPNEPNFFGATMARISLWKNHLHQFLASNQLGFVWLRLVVRFAVRRSLAGTPEEPEGKVALPPTLPALEAMSRADEASAVRQTGEIKANQTTFIARQIAWSSRSGRGRHSAPPRVAIRH